MKGIKEPLEFKVEVVVEHFDGEGKLISRQSTEDGDVHVQHLPLEELEKLLKEKAGEMIENGGNE